MPIPQRGQPDPVAKAADRLDYFMVKIRRSASHPSGEFAGVVERLGSGEKREFKNCDELARVVDEWTR